MPLRIESRGSAIFVWGLLAILNLSAAVAIASWPERRADLDTIRGWGADWLFRARNIYAVEQAWPEYPPHAIVLLSPLSWLPENWAAPWWAGFNIGLAVLASYLAVHVVRPHLTLSTAALPMLMFLCWGGFRALLQFSLLSLTLGLLSMTLAEKRPIWSGICLGLGLMKPQVCVPFFLWAMFERRFRTLAVAIFVVATGFVLYCVRVHASPVQVVVDYAAIVRRYYIGDAIMYGLAQPRPLIELMTTDDRIVDVVVVSVALVMLAIVCTIGVAEARRTRLLYAAPPLAGLWSVVTFYQLTYGLVILLPLAALLLFEDERATGVFRRRLFWALQLTMMFDLTVLWRWFGPFVQAPAMAGALLIHADRVIFLAFFVCVVSLALRTLRGSPSPQRVL